MDATNIERITAFEERFARTQTTSMVELPWGYALLHRDFPFSYVHNRIVVTSPAPSAEIAATTEEILGNARLRHRYITVLGSAPELAGDLEALGYDHESVVTMIYQGAPAQPSEYKVHDVSFEQLRPALIRDWMVDLPGRADDVYDQLADRASWYTPGADIARLVVFDGDQIAARADLHLDRDDTIGQFESLMCHPDYRGKGYSTSIANEAIRRNAQANNDLLFLVADLNDWPRHWYQRLGFVDSAYKHNFVRSG